MSSTYLEDVMLGTLGSGDTLNCGVGFGDLPPSEGDGDITFSYTNGTEGWVAEYFSHQYAEANAYWSSGQLNILGTVEDGWSIKRWRYYPSYDITFNADANITFCGQRTPNVFLRCIFAVRTSPEGLVTGQQQFIGTSYECVTCNMSNAYAPGTLVYIEILGSTYDTNSCYVDSVTMDGFTLDGDTYNCGIRLGDS